ncbi:unnamed protein product [Toxocara canis]|nr:unnamed protein product [Toxocara canis]
MDSVWDGFSEQIEECGFYEGYTLQRFVIISAASTVSFLGIIANCILLVIFIRSLPNSLYSAVLALLDGLLCMVYLLLFGVDAEFVYLRIEALFIIYHAYMIPVFILSRIVQFAMPYMLILATFERFVWTAGKKTRMQLAKLCSRKGRLISVIITISTSIILRMPIAYAMEVKSFPNCSDFFRSMSVSPTEWAIDNQLYYVFDLHVMSFAQTFFPFIVLLFLNSFIVYRLLRTKREQIYAALKLSRLMKHSNKSELSPKRSSCTNMQSSTLRENFMLIELTAQVMRESLGARKQNGRKQLRCAVYTMVAIVCTYLISNSLHLMLTTLERSGTKILVDESDPNVSSNFYIAFSDTVSFCYMFTSAIRILIYAMCNPTLRLQIESFLKGTAPEAVEQHFDDETSFNRSQTASR